jgi:beta-phosphoglucomutase family hydrolase
MTRVFAALVPPSNARLNGVVSEPPVRWESFDAVLFDLDGVVTNTASAHAFAWKQMFDEYLERRATREHTPFRPFDIDGDYRNFVDGKPRADGVDSFLRSRAIELPRGDVDDPPDRETVCGLGNRKNELLLEMLERDGVDVFPDGVALLRAVRARGLHTAVVTSSKNCSAVLHATGLVGEFDAVVDGNLVEQLALAGKPAPDAFLHAAALLGVTAARAVVLEDAIAGVEAGHAGGFGLVIGVDRSDGVMAEALRAAGADVVTGDLTTLFSPR